MEKQKLASAGSASAGSNALRNPNLCMPHAELEGYNTPQQFGDLQLMLITGFHYKYLHLSPYHFDKIYLTYNFSLPQAECFWKD